ncbi:lysylphosphatidylglycerol synthase transmembrane domain-containing protein [Desulfovibrio inopinatus]|uniref:lysylphosphatidylglycerol synthase transmembrane domain-containing protein n=1 Tax=Desulfovibrio inopinatus TaxID=102109 RepID=UPI0003FCECA5|nr:lysylphosphatidylglycerol synthase transmembrane domain-containing protein [Desulfovibrio inopinatus]
MLVKKTLSLIIRFAFVAGCLVYAFWGIDFGLLFDTLKNYNGIAIVGTILFQFLSYGTMAMRLDFLSRFKAGNKTCLKAFLLSMAVNNIVPAKLGELAKAFYFRRECSFSLGQSISMVFWERFFDLNAMLALGTIVAFMFGVNVAFIPLFIVVSSIWAGLIFIRLFPDLSHKLIQLVPIERVRGFLAEIKLQILHGVTPWFLVILGVYTLVCWVFYSGTTILTLFWVADMPITFWQAMTVFVISAVGMATPSSPGSVGVFEAAVTFSLGLFGIDKEQALAAGLVLHMIQYIPVTVLGIAVLARSGLNLQRIRQSDEDLA